MDELTNLNVRLNDSNVSNNMKLFQSIQVFVTVGMIRFISSIPFCYTAASGTEDDLLMDSDDERQSNDELPTQAIDSSRDRCIHSLIGETICLFRTVCYR